MSRDDPGLPTLDRALIAIEEEGETVEGKEEKIENLDPDDPTIPPTRWVGERILVRWAGNRWVTIRNSDNLNRQTPSPC